MIKHLLSPGYDPQKHQKEKENYLKLNYKENKKKKLYANELTLSSKSSKFLEEQKLPKLTKEK
jgi:hypothetical protein